MIGIQNLHVVRQFKVTGGDDAVAGLLQPQIHVLTTAFQLEDHAFEVKKDVHDVFDDAVDLGVFVHNTHDARFRGGITHHGAQEDAAKRVSERVAVAAFERFERDDREIGVLLVNHGFDGGRLQKRCICHELLSYSIPSARYTDKAEFLTKKAENFRGFLIRLSVRHLEGNRTLSAGRTPAKDFRGLGALH